MGRKKFEKLKKKKFYHHKSPIFKRYVDIEKVLVSNKIFCGERIYRYFNGSLYNDHKVKPFHIMVSETSAYVKSFDGQTKWMYFLIENDDVLEKYNTIDDKVSADIKKNLIASLSIIKSFSKPKSSFMLMKLPIFKIKKFLR